MPGREATFFLDLPANNDVRRAKAWIVEHPDGGCPCVAVQPDGRVLGEFEDILQALQVTELMFPRAA